MRMIVLLQFVGFITLVALIIFWLLDLSLVLGGLCIFLFWLCILFY